jgi:DNA modification methylase
MTKLKKQSEAVQKTQLPKWRNRIVGHGEEDPTQLLANPKNWRIHPKAQQDALVGVLNEVGWVQDVIVNDPFLGSGTTLIAAEVSERLCYGPELDPKYCDLILTRWQDFTGKEATLEGSGQTFAEIARSRTGAVPGGDRVGPEATA